MRYSLLSLIVILFALSACEKVIDIELDDAEPRIVIQGEIWEGTNDVSINIKETRSFYTQEEQNIITDAMVTLYDQDMNAVTLEHQSNGDYTSSNYTATVGQNYTLEVNVGDKTYQAVSQMPTPVALDSLTSEFVPGMFGQEGGYLVFMYYQDDPNVNNYYRAFSWKNGEELNSAGDLWLNDSNFTNGNYITIPLFTQTFALGDTVDIRFTTIDSSAYDYFVTLAGIAGQGGGNNAAPANPNSNFDNGALGYFGAFNGSELRIIVEE